MTVEKAYRISLIRILKKFKLIEKDEYSNLSIDELEILYKIIIKKGV